MTCEWTAESRAEILARAAGRCEQCGGDLPAIDAEMVQTNWIEPWDQSPDSVKAMCNACARAMKFTGDAPTAKGPVTT